MINNVLKRQLNLPYPLVVVVGETASGKSALAYELARKFSGEIIAADSWTVRKRLDIGTAKPSLVERKEVSHHLVDIVEPCQDFTAALYKKLAKKAINKANRANKLPIMVGGTGLYIDSVLYDYSFLPPGKKEKRNNLNMLSMEQLLRLIKNEQIDLTGIDIHNKRRLIRLLETGGKKPKRTSNIRPNTLIIGLKINRSILRKNIERRVEMMFRRGLRYEVQNLVNEFGWDCEGLKGIGYQEWRNYFKGSQSLQKTKQKIIKNTLELAKRQRTWFKRNQTIYWIDEPRMAVSLVRGFLTGKK